SLLNDALRMKCWVFVSASQRMITLWSALTTGMFGGGAGQQAGAAGDSKSQTSKASATDRASQERTIMVEPPEGERGKEGRLLPSSLLRILKSSRGSYQESIKAGRPLRPAASGVPAIGTRSAHGFARILFAVYSERSD